MVNHLEHRPSHGQLPLDLLAHGGVQVVGLHVGQLGPGHDGLALDAAVNDGVLCNRERNFKGLEDKTFVASFGNETRLGIGAATDLFMLLCAVGEDASASAAVTVAPSAAAAAAAVELLLQIISLLLPSIFLLLLLLNLMPNVSLATRSAFSIKSPGWPAPPPGRPARPSPPEAAPSAGRARSCVSTPPRAAWDPPWGARPGAGGTRGCSRSCGENVKENRRNMLISVCERNINLPYVCVKQRAWTDRTFEYFSCKNIKIGQRNPDHIKQKVFLPSPMQMTVEKKKSKKIRGPCCCCCPLLSFNQTCAVCQCPCSAARP